MLFLFCFITALICSVQENVPQKLLNTTNTKYYMAEYDADCEEMCSRKELWLFNVGQRSTIGNIVIGPHALA